VLILPLPGLNGGAERSLGKGDQIHAPQISKQPRHAHKNAVSPSSRAYSPFNPMQFVRVESGVARTVFLRSKIRDNLFDRKFFAIIFGRPTKKAKIIPDGPAGGIPFYIVIHTGARSRCSFSSHLVVDEWNVGESRRVAPSARYSSMCWVCSIGSIYARDMTCGDLRSSIRLIVTK